MSKFRALTILGLCCLVMFSGCRRRGGGEVEPDYARELAPGERALVAVPMSQLPPLRLSKQHVGNLREGIQHSLSYLKTKTAAKHYPHHGIQLADVQRGLERLDQLLAQGANEQQIRSVLQREFNLYRSIGYDRRGRVLFTGYYTPIFDARRKPEGNFAHPLYRRPAQLTTVAGRTDEAYLGPISGGQRFPARAAIEQDPSLRGEPIVYLSNALDAFIIHVQGSAKLRLASGAIIDVGVDGTNGQPYLSLRNELITDGHLQESNAGLPGIQALYRRDPQLVQRYMQRNPRFVFFTETNGGPFGSIGRPVTTDVSIATDKDIFPPGALCLIDTPIGMGPNARRAVELRLDQDTGGAIKAPGRCDLYMGVGAEAEARAGVQLGIGQLYYLVAR